MIISNPGIKPKNKHLQSILASSKIRLLKLRKKNAIKTTEKKVVLTTKEATLEGYISKRTNADKLYILLHGWEGSANSTYIQLLANTLFLKKDASVFRLNFRDHGDTHHLNKELFHSCRLEEVVDSIKEITKLFPHKSIYLCGFSLGGNFSLRVASKVYDKKIPLDKIFAISPPINPKNSMIAIEKSPLYSKYFMKKWQKSLLKKAKIYPELLKHKKFSKINSLDKLTELLIIRNTTYKTTDDYFKGYQITENIVEKIKVETHVLTSWDDPVIPFDDFLILEKKKNIKLITTKNGGHCGFIMGWNLHSWIEDYICDNT